MSHTVTLHHIMRVYHDMFDHMDVIMWALAMKKTPGMEDLYFAMKLAQQELSKYYPEVSPMMGMLLIPEHIPNPFRKLRSYRKWYKGLDINPEDKISCTTQYQEAFLKYVENEYYASHRRVPVITPKSIPSNDLFPRAMASGSGQSSFYPYAISSDVKNTESLTLRLKQHPDDAIVQYAQCPLPGSIWIHHLNHLRMGGKVIQISVITTPTKWRVAVHFGFRISPTDGANKSKCTQSTQISRMWHATCSLLYPMVLEGRPVPPLVKMLSTGSSQKPRCVTLCKNVVVRQFARANDWMLAGNDPALEPMNTETNLDMKRVAEARK